MEITDDRGLKHDTDDKHCRYNDGFHTSWLTALVMGICCNTCRSLPPVLKQKWDLDRDSVVTIRDKQYVLRSYSAHSGGVMDPDGSSEIVIYLDAVI